MARGTAVQGTPPPVQRPFATAHVVEDAQVRARAVGAAEPGPEGMGFVDGTQRWSVEGHLGLNPVVRAQVAACVLVRVDGRLRSTVQRTDEFLVVPGGRLGADERRALDRVQIPVLETEADPRPHPFLDRWAAAQVVERRRVELEQAVCRAFLAEVPTVPLVVDGGLAGLRGVPGADRAIGVIKQHETQFLDGADLATALTVPEGSRSSVFARELDDGTVTLTWYLRLWPWSEEDLLHGLTRVERIAGEAVVAEADRVSRWLLAERAPIAGRDARWDRLLYPLHEVETVLRAQAGGWL